MKPFAPAILAEDRPECPPHVQRNESEKKAAPYAYQTGAYRCTRVTQWRTSGNACAATTSGDPVSSASPTDGCA